MSTVSVQPGNTLHGIAKANGVTLGELLAANPQFTQGGRNPNLIVPGENVKIPEKKFSQSSGLNQPVAQCPESICFVAVADRAVGGTLGMFYHYSLQYWKISPDIALNSEMEVVDVTALGASQLGQVELLRNNDGWDVWESKQKWFRDQRVWKEEGVSISVVHFTDSSTKLAAIHKGPCPDVKAIWDTIRQNAAQYEYAEQGGDSFTGVFKKWPNSKYQMPWDEPFNNSNTFVREMVSRAGLAMFELGGSHPGDNAPSPVLDIYGSDPWGSGQTAPPAPETAP